MLFIVVVLVGYASVTYFGIGWFIVGYKVGRFMEALARLFKETLK